MDNLNFSYKQKTFTKEPKIILLYWKCGQNYHAHILVNK